MKTCKILPHWPVRTQGEAASLSVQFFFLTKAESMLRWLRSRGWDLPFSSELNATLCIVTLYLPLENINQTKHTCVETSIMLRHREILFHEKKKLTFVLQKPIIVVHMNGETYIHLYTFCYLARICSVRLSSFCQKMLRWLLQLTITITTRPHCIFFTAIWPSEGICALVCAKPQS